MHGVQEVGGSNPLAPTSRYRKNHQFWWFFVIYGGIKIGDFLILKEGVQPGCNQ